MKIGEIDTDFNISEVYFTITEERARTISFSNPLYKIGTSLVIKRRIIIDNMKFSLLSFYTFLNYAKAIN